MYEKLIQDLRDRAEFLQKANRNNTYNSFAETMSRAADAIEELESVVDNLNYLNKTKPRWIPVTERLPEDSGYYIVCAKDGSLTHVSFVKYQYRYKSWLLSGARAYWKITHWMPLPEPPKED